MKSFVIFVFLFLIILLILYFIDFPTISRCHKLKNSKSNIFFDTYKNKKKNTVDKVIVSFTTTPERIQHITPMLNSLLDQTVKIDTIVLNIPEENKGKKYNIPKEYDDICNIYTVGKDYGKGTKYIPTLLRENECGSKIILLDDDHLYGKDLLEKLIKESDNNPNKCIYASDKFSGSGGILIKPEFIHSLTHDKCDDMWLENNLKVDKINIVYTKNRKYM